MTMLWLGGIIIPWTEEATVRAVANSRSYPFWTIIGIMIGPVEEMSATAEPDTPPKNIESMQLTIASPPGNGPTMM